MAIHNGLVAAANRPTASHEGVLKGLTSYLVSGDALPPRRLKDWTEMNVRSYDTKSDSYPTCTSGRRSTTGLVARKCTRRTWGLSLVSGNPM